VRSIVALAIIAIFQGVPAHAFLGFAQSKHSKASRAYHDGDYEKSQNLYEELVREKPKSLEYLFGLAASLHRQGDYEMAISIGETILNLQTQSRNGAANLDMQALANYNIGVALVKLEKYSDALERFKAAMIIDSTSERARKNYESLKKFLEDHPNLAEEKEVESENTEVASTSQITSPELEVPDMSIDFDFTLDDLRELSGLDSLELNPLQAQEVINAATSGAEVDIQAFDKLLENQTRDFKQKREQMSQLSIRIAALQAQLNEEDHSAQADVLLKRDELRAKIRRQVEDHQVPEEGEDEKEGESFANYLRKSDNWLKAKRDDGAAAQLPPFDSSHGIGTRDQDGKEKEKDKELSSGNFYVEPLVAGENFGNKHYDTYKDEIWKTSKVDYTPYNPEHTFDPNQVEYALLNEGPGRKIADILYYQLVSRNHLAPHPDGFKFEDPSQIDSYRVVKNSLGDFVLEIKGAQSETIGFRYHLTPDNVRSADSSSLEPLMEKLPEELIELSKSYVHPNMSDREKAEGIQAMILEWGLYTKEDNELDQYIQSCPEGGKTCQIERLSNLLLQNDKLPAHLKGRGADCDCWSALFVAVARHYGVQANMIVGFASDGSGHLHDQLAHGWAEAYDPVSATWVEYNPTPSSDPVKKDMQSLLIERSKVKVEMHKLGLASEIPNPRKIRSSVEIQLKNIREQAYLKQLALMSYHGEVLKPAENKEATVEHYQEFKSKVLLQIKQSIERAKQPSTSAMQRRELINHAMRMLYEMIKVGNVDHDQEFYKLIQEAKKVSESLGETTSFYQVLAETNQGQLIRVGDRAFWKMHDSFALKPLPIDLRGQDLVPEALVSEDGKHFAILSLKIGGKWVIHHNGKRIESAAVRVSDLRVSEDFKDLYHLESVSKHGDADVDYYGGKQQLHKNNQMILDQFCKSLSTRRLPYYLCSVEGSPSKPEDIVLYYGDNVHNRVPVREGYYLRGFNVDGKGNEYAELFNPEVYKKVIDGPDDSTLPATLVFFNGKLVLDSLPRHQLEHVDENGFAMFVYYGPWNSVYFKRKGDSAEFERTELNVTDEQKGPFGSVHYVPQNSAADGDTIGYSAYLHVDTKQIPIKYKGKALVNVEHTNLTAVGGRRFIADPTRRGKSANPGPFYIAPGLYIADEKSGELVPEPILDQLGMDWPLEMLRSYNPSDPSAEFTMHSRGHFVVVRDGTVLQAVPIPKVDLAGRSNSWSSGSSSYFERDNGDSFTDVDSGRYGVGDQYHSASRSYINGVEFLSQENISPGEFTSYTSERTSPENQEEILSIKNTALGDFKRSIEGHQAIPFDELMGLRIVPESELLNLLNTIKQKDNPTKWDYTQLVRNLLFYRPNDEEGSSAWQSLYDFVYTNPKDLLEIELEEDLKSQFVLLPLTSASSHYSEAMEANLLQLATQWGVQNNIREHFFGSIDDPRELMPLLTREQTQFLQKLGYESQDQWLP